jgi:hypothetical protein
MFHSHHQWIFFFCFRELNLLSKVSILLQCDCSHTQDAAFWRWYAEKLGLVVHDVGLKDIFIVQKAATTTLYVSLSIPSGYILACIETNEKWSLVSHKLVAAASMRNAIDSID